MAAEEDLDIVDDQDRVVGRAPRSRVLRDYHIHRAVMFFVFDAEGNVFVNQRSDRKESYDAAAAREIAEETGLSAPARQIGAFQKRTADERENVRVYAVTADRDLNLFADEIAQGSFMSLAELNQMVGRADFLPETPDLLKILVAHTSRRESPGAR
jgi:isopentenyldiphosphate isomerase